LIAQILLHVNFRRIRHIFTAGFQAWPLVSFISLESPFWIYIVRIQIGLYFRAILRYVFLSRLPSPLSSLKNL
jgi:hypothetical protein